MGLLDGIRRGVFALDASDGDVLDAERIPAQAAQAPVHGILKIGEQSERLMGAVGNDGETAWNHDGPTYCTPRATCHRV
jgi:hypothetical protein